MIKILKAGILDTLQDNGRFGFAGWGVNTNGAMDTFAMNAANALVGNELDSTVLEMHFPAPEILFLKDSIISLTGADFSPAINGKSIPAWKSVQVPAGAMITFARKIKGMRCYLAMHGGLDVPGWLGSKSTNLKSKTGGFYGRALRKDDEINSHKKTVNVKMESDISIFPWSVNHSFVYDNNRVHLLPGKEWDWLDQPSVDAILNKTFSMEPSSDRMASFLRHDALGFRKKEQLLSSAVDFGTIQALPSGKLCVLMADHQTTGGYPRVAHIISAHLPKFSQLTPGEPFTFSQTSIEDAEKMLLSLQATLLNLKNSLYQKLAERYGID